MLKVTLKNGNEYELLEDTTVYPLSLIHIYMIRDVPGKVRKRMGWQVKRTLDGRINGYHALMGHDPLVHEMCIRDRR